MSMTVEWKQDDVSQQWCTGSCSLHYELRLSRGGSPDETVVARVSLIAAGLQHAAGNCKLSVKELAQWNKRAHDAAPSTTMDRYDTPYPMKLAIRLRCETR